MQSPARHLLRLVIAALALILAPALFAADGPGRYTVRAGDYLTLIAQRCGVTVADLRQANNVKGDLIHPGQGLVVPQPFRRTAARDIRWRRPFNGSGGETLHTFGNHTEAGLETRRTGVDMTLPPGSNVYAPSHGVIRYRGHQDGYGIIMILEHGAGYATVLGPFDAEGTYAGVGQIVLRGDVLGRSGPPEEGSRPYLHVELRRHNEAVDPARLFR